MLSRSVHGVLVALLLLVAGVFAAETAPETELAPETEQTQETEPVSEIESAPETTQEAEVNPLQKGVTGIQAIDSLKVNEWDIPTSHNSLAVTMLLSLLPGGGHYYTEHYVRGGFITGIELALFYEVVYNKDYQYRRVLEQAAPFRDSVSIYTKKIMELQTRDSLEYFQSKRNESLNRVRAYNDKKMEQEDLRKAETAWLYGLHLYGMIDAFGIWYKNNYRSVEQKSMKNAVLWAIIPGFGQMYNGEFGKAGLLYMGLMGSSVSIWTSQNMVEYYLDRKHLQAGEDVSSEDYERIAERVTYYRKNRNQYIWAMALLYLYSIGDAAVDALLSDFDNPLHLALLPNLNGGAQAVFTFDF